MRSGWVCSAALVISLSVPARAPRELTLASAHFDASGAHVPLAHGAPLRFTLAEVRRDDASTALTSSPPRRDGDHVELERGDGIVEWWRVDARGLEHGVTLAKRPVGRGPLVLEMSTGERRAELEGDGIALRDTDGTLVATYRELVVLDAIARRVPAHMTADDGRLGIVVDDADARYPIVVDPLLVTERATLELSAVAASDSFGLRVDVTRDGTRAVIGAFADDVDGVANAGSATVLVRDGDGWTVEAVLVAAELGTGDELGRAVSISDDGVRIAVGAPRSDVAGTDAGAVWLFERVSGTWRRNDTPLTGAAMGDAFGASVALTPDGRRIAIGAPGTDRPGATDAGAAFVLRKGLGGGTSYATVEGTLLSSAPAPMDRMGESIDIDAGGWVIVGTPGDDTTAGGDSGSVTFFSRAGAAWSELATVLPMAPASSIRFGAAVALSADATRAIVGAPNESGSADVLSWTGVAWAHEAHLTLAPSFSSLFGSAVSLSADGSRAVVGAPLDDTAVGFDAGSARIYLRSGTDWALEHTFDGGSSAMHGGVGTSVSMTGDGALALVGAPFEDVDGVSGAGSARTLLRDGTGWSEGARIRAFGDGARERLGDAVALSADGQRAIVGRPSASSDRGSAEVFVRSGDRWAREATLAPADLEAGDRFGVSLALSDDAAWAIVGAPGDALGAGTVRVFRRTISVWVEVGPMSPVDASPGDRFGAAVSLSADGTRALVGAPGDAPSGSARVFLRTATFAEEGVLVVPSAGVDVGSAVALSADGTTAIVGTPNANGSARGGATTFVRGPADWMPDARLTPTVGASARAGSAVAIDAAGDTALVGAPGDAGGAGGAGSAHAFVRRGASWEAMTFGGAGMGNDRAGAAVALSRDGLWAFVGAPGADDAASDVGAVRAFVRSRDGWRADGTLYASATQPGDEVGASLSIADVGLLVGAPGDDSARGIDAGSARLFSIAGELGSPCSALDACLSGHCTDGVCCDVACGDGAIDCMACNGAATGGDDGTCAALSTAIAATIECRAAVAGGCDVADHCIAGSVVCPADEVAGAGITCRPALGACDTAERCNGVAPTCPSDALVGSGVVCHPSTGGCDPAERCDGASAACPGDVLSPSGTECGGDVEGSCTSPGVCDGERGICVGGAPFDAGTECAPAEAGVTCDAPDTCDGAGVCLPRYQPADIACGSTTLAGPCDAPNHCHGASTACVDAFLSDVTCRPSIGVCDAAETCSGDAPDCPADRLAEPGVVCRDSSDLSCNPLESCDGASAACPADIDECSGVDAGRPPDAAIDAGSVAPPLPAASCSCHAGSSATPWPLFLVALLLMRRRRRHSSMQSMRATLFSSTHSTLASP